MELPTDVPGEYAAARERDQALADFARRLTLAPDSSAAEELREHLSLDEVYDAIAVVGLLNLADRVALATGITTEDDLE